MEAVVEKLYVNVPAPEVAFFRELAGKMGWEVSSREALLQRYISARPQNVGLTDDDIMEEVRAVRYATH